MRPSQPSWGMARVEVETTQDNMEDLSWEKDDDNLLCGVLGEVETALGSSILVLAVSGPDYATSDDDNDDSKQQTGELFAASSQMSRGHPVLGQDVPPCPRQQHGSTKQLYLCAKQLNKTASAAHIVMKVEMKPSLKKMKKGGVMATCRFPAMQGLVRAAPRYYRYVHCTCAVAYISTCI